MVFWLIVVVLVCGLRTWFSVWGLLLVCCFLMVGGVCWRMFLVGFTCFDFVCLVVVFVVNLVLVIVWRWVGFV